MIQLKSGFKNIKFRGCPGHPEAHVVTIFTRTDSGGKKYLSLPFVKATTLEDHVLVATTNPLIARHITKTVRCKQEAHPLIVPKCIADTTRVDLMTLLSVACSLSNREVEWFVNYYIAADTNPEHFRALLQSMVENADE